MIQAGAFYETAEMTPVSYGNAAGEDSGDDGGRGSGRHPEQWELTCASQLDEWQSLRDKHLQPPQHQFLKNLSAMVKVWPRRAKIHSWFVIFFIGRSKVTELVQTEDAVFFQN